MDDDTRKFLRTCFETFDFPEAARLNLWTLEDKRSAWFHPHDLDNACRHAAAQNAKNCYIGVYLAPRDMGADHRCEKGDVAGIYGLWLDVDVAGPAHSKPRLPLNKIEAREALALAELLPTIVVDSGHGLQGWWLFKEPWLFGSDAERLEAQAMSDSWQVMMRSRMARRHWSLDGTADLSRVLRLPGTINHKTTPLPVKIIEFNHTVRYDPADFRDMLPVAAGIAQAHAKGCIDFSVVDGAKPDYEKFGLIMRSKRFADTWEKKRTDLDDQSDSGYEQSLSTLAAINGWTAQEIIDMLIAFRAKHGGKEKCSGYYQKTLEKAFAATVKMKEESEVVRVREKMEESALEDTIKRLEQSRKPPAVTPETNGQPYAHEATPGTAPAAARPETAPIQDLGSMKAAALRQLSDLLGVNVIRFIRHPGGRKVLFRMVLDEGSILLGGPEVLQSRILMERRTIALAKKLIKKHKRGWDKIATLILGVCEDDHTGHEADELTLTTSWVEDYLTIQSIADNVDDGVKTQSPFRDEAGVIWFFGPAFRDWLRVNRNKKLTANEMGAALRASGFSPKAYPVTILGNPTTRSAWAELVKK